MTIDENTAAQIERGPHSLAMLARIFEAMTPSELTLRWVKMFAEAMGAIGANADTIERCLKPVADRLKNRQPSKLRRTPPKRVSDIEAASQPMAAADHAADIRDAPTPRSDL